MADRDRSEADPKGQLFDRLDDIRAGMLGVEGSGQHHQPMTHYADPDTGELWFITSRETDLAEFVGAHAGGMAHYCIVSPKSDYYACLRGRIEQVDDEAKLDELWNAMASAWFEKGREDHDVTLLRLRLSDASIWATTRNPLVFGIEIARSVRSEHMPDIGEHEIVEWPHAA